MIFVSATRKRVGPIWGDARSAMRLHGARLPPRNVLPCEHGGGGAGARDTPGVHASSCTCPVAVRRLDKSPPNQQYGGAMDDPRVQRSMPARAPRLAGVLVACMALLAVSAYRRAAPACQKGCNRAKSSCLEDAPNGADAARSACSGTRAEKRACRKRVKGALRDSRSACTRFRRGCGTCCAQGGSLCDTRCGDSIVTAARGEQCDPPGSACPGAGTCSESCQCPAIPTTTTTQPAPTTTSTQPTPTTTSTQPTPTTTSTQPTPTTTPTTTAPTVTTTSTTLPPTTRVCFEAIASGNARAAASACGIAALAAPQDPAVLLAAAAASAMAA